MGNPYDDGRFIEGIAIDWDAVDPHSYVRRIPALRALERLDFDERELLQCGDQGAGIWGFRSEIGGTDAFA